MAEIELGVLQRQCLDLRIDNRDFLSAEVDAWKRRRNLDAGSVNWHFSTTDALHKLRKLYPSFHD